MCTKKEAFISKEGKDLESEKRTCLENPVEKSQAVKNKTKNLENCTKTKLSGKFKTKN